VNVHDGQARHPEGVPEHPAKEWTACEAIGIAVRETMLRSPYATPMAVTKMPKLVSTPYLRRYSIIIKINI